MLVCAGLARAQTATGSNPALIKIPATGSGVADPGPPAPATPYPSDITISGASGTVLDVNLTLHNVNHTLPRDMDVMLVSPAGQNLMVLSDTGTNSAVANATLTLDDEAAAPLSRTTPMTTGTYQPFDSDNVGFDAQDAAFPAPAPAASAATALSVFDGFNPNGTWRLYVVDDADGDIGSIAGGWTLSLTVGAASLPGALRFGSPTYTGAEGEGPATITVTRTGGSDGAVSASFSTVAGGTATAASDYSAVVNQTVSFADGETTKTVTVPVVDDGAVEGINETVHLQLANPQGGATLGSPATAVLSLEDDDATFNTTPVTIPAFGNGLGTGAPATPYPSRIRVTGLGGQVISDVNVTLHGFSHTEPRDVDVLLAGPNGQNVMLLSDAGTPGAAPSNQTYVVDDEAATAFPIGAAMPGGSYRPTDNDVDGPDAFPAPAPAPSAATALDVFDGQGANGTWSLYVVDDAGGDLGSLSGGWTLNLTTSTLPVPGTLQFGAPTFAGAEGDGPATVTVTRTGGTDGAVSARFSTVAGGSASAGSDYEVVTDQLVSFADGETSRTVTVPVLDDGAVESADETVRLQLSDPQGGATLGARATADLRIEDDDSTCNTSAIALPGSGMGFPAGAPGSVYPSRIHVRGAGDDVRTVTVTVSGISHTSPRDIDLLLAGPGGENVLLLSDAGGASPVTDTTLVFSDAAAGGVPAGMASGTYRPTDDDAAGADPAFPAPAPAFSGASDLSTFTGTDPNGAWSLYAVDDASGDVGAIAGGWCLDVTSNRSPVVATPIPDQAATIGEPFSLAVAADAFTDPDGDALSYTAGLAGGEPLPDWLTFTPNTRSFAGTPPAGARGTTLDVRVRAEDPFGASVTEAFALAVGDHAPSADAGGPYSVAEGDGVTLDASASADPDGDALTYAWDLDGDTQYDDADGVSPALTWAQLVAAGIEDGPAPYSVAVRVTDGGADDATDGAPLTVANTGPAAEVSGASGGRPGTALSFTLTATDPSPADQAAPFSWAVDWDGDGTTDETVTGTSPQTVEHAFPAAGDVTVRAAATDRDGATGAPATRAVSVGVPGVDLSPATLAFGDQTTGTASAAREVVVTNSGTQPLAVSAVTLAGSDPGQFALGTETCTAAAVAPATTCTVAVAFAPTAAGARSATLQLVSDEPGSPHAVALTGTGVVGPAPTPTATPTASPTASPSPSPTATPTPPVITPPRGPCARVRTKFFRARVFANGRIKVTKTRRVKRVRKKALKRGRLVVKVRLRNGRTKTVRKRVRGCPARGARP